MVYELKRNPVCDGRGEQLEWIKGACGASKNIYSMYEKDEVDVRKSL